MELKVTSFSKEKFLTDNIDQLSSFGIVDKNVSFLISKGFTVKEILMYGITTSNYDSYLPESIRHKITLNTNSGYWPILHDKLIFHDFIKGKLPTPKLLGTVFRGKVFSTNIELFNPSISYNRQYVLKPLQGGRGRGIFFVKVQNGRFFLQEEEKSMEQIQTLIKSLDQYGVFVHVKQSIEIANMYPGSTNTIRLISMYDFENEEPFLYSAVLRVGWNESKPFDNFSQGGLVMNIDLNTGELSGWKRKGKEGTIIEGSVHPDTNFIFEGFVIPYWATIKTKVLSFLKEHPFFNYVGWDIMLTDDGFTVIEGNHNPDLDLIQVFGGYLSDKRSKELFNTLKVYGE